MLSGTAKFLSTLPALPKDLQVAVGGGATMVCGSEFVTVAAAKNDGADPQVSKQKVPTTSQDAAVAVVASAEGVYTINGGRLVSSVDGAVPVTLPQEFSSLLAAGDDEGKNLQILANKTHVAVLSPETGLLAFVVVGQTEWTVVSSVVTKKASAGGNIVASAISLASDTDDCSAVVLVRALEEGGFQIFRVSLKSTSGNKKQNLVSCVVSHDSKSKKKKAAAAGTKAELFSSLVTSGTIKSLTVSAAGEGAVLWSSTGADDDAKHNASPLFSLWGVDGVCHSFPVCNLLQQNDGSNETGDEVQATAQEEPLSVVFSAATATFSAALLMLIRKISTNDVALVEYKVADLLRLLSGSSTAEADSKLGSDDLLTKREAGTVVFPSSGAHGTGKLRSFVTTTMAVSATAAVVAIQRQLYLVALKNSVGSGANGSGVASLSVMEQALLKLAAKKAADNKKAVETATPVAVVAGGIKIKELVQALDSTKCFKDYLAHNIGIIATVVKTVKAVFVTADKSDDTIVSVLRDSLFVTSNKQQHLVLEELLRSNASSSPKKNAPDTSAAAMCDRMCVYLGEARGVSMTTKMLFLGAIIKASSTSLQSSTGMVAPSAELVNMCAKVLVAASRNATTNANNSSSKEQTTEVATMIRRCQKSGAAAGGLDAATCASLVTVLYPLTLHILESAPHVGTLVPDCVQLTDALFVAHQVGGGGSSTSSGDKKNDEGFWQLLPKQLPYDFQHLFQVVGHWCMSEPGTYIGYLTVNCGPESKAKKEPAVVDQVAYKVNTSHSTRITREVFTLPK